MSRRRSPPAGAPGAPSGVFSGRSAPNTSDGRPAGANSPLASAARLASAAALRAARLRAEPDLPSPAAKSRSSVSPANAPPPLYERSLALITRSSNARARRPGRHYTRVSGPSGMEVRSTRRIVCKAALLALFALPVFALSSPPAGARGVPMARAEQAARQAVLQHSSYREIGA